ncbi:hypothetical protein K501DRAFT_180162 [Backusella circina FSU 941]|nr:hypothetical protein K501DRAFT_180162 [Backusella circina FSU 941]
MLHKLPPELLSIVLSYISCNDLATLRLLSKQLCTFCDYPVHWKSIILAQEDHSIWQLQSIKAIIDPHLYSIKSITVEKVRDSVVRYILSRCLNLTCLSICGWLTLSDHSLRLPSQQLLRLEKLELIGSTSQPNYISVDARTLGKLLVQSPNLKDLLILCQVHIHAETFVSELEKSPVRLSLRSLTLATRKTWLDEHVHRLVSRCPEIQNIRLIQGFDRNENSNFESWCTRRMNSIHWQNSLVSNSEFIVYNSLFDEHRARR